MGFGGEGFVSADLEAFWDAWRRSEKAMELTIEETTVIVQQGWARLMHGNLLLVRIPSRDVGPIPHIVREALWRAYQIKRRDDDRFLRSLRIAPWDQSWTTR